MMSVHPLPSLCSKGSPNLLKITMLRYIGQRAWAVDIWAVIKQKLMESAPAWRVSCLCVSCSHACSSKKILRVNVRYPSSCVINTHEQLETRALRGPLGVGTHDLGHICGLSPPRNAQRGVTYPLNCPYRILPPSPFFTMHPHFASLV